MWHNDGTKILWEKRNDKNPVYFKESLTNGSTFNLLMWGTDLLFLACGRALWTKWYSVWLPNIYTDRRTAIYIRCHFVSCHWYVASIQFLQDNGRQFLFDYAMNIHRHVIRKRFQLFNRMIISRRNGSDKQLEKKRRDNWLVKDDLASSLPSFHHLGRNKRILSGRTKWNSPVASQKLLDIP